MVDISIQLGAQPNPTSTTLNMSTGAANTMPGQLSGANSAPLIPSLNKQVAGDITINLNKPQEVEKPYSQATDSDTGIKLNKTYTHELNSAAKLGKNKHLDGKVERQDDGRNRMNILMSTLGHKGADDVAKITQHWPINASSMFAKVAKQKTEIDEDTLDDYAEKHPIFDRDDLKTLFDTTFDVDGDGVTTQDEFAQVSDSGKALAGKKRNRRHRQGYFD
jgi:hypothetical protein